MDEPEGNGARVQTPVGSLSVSGRNGPLYLAVLVLAGALGSLIWVIVGAIGDLHTGREKAAAMIESRADQQHADIADAIVVLTEAIEDNTRTAQQNLCMNSIAPTNAEARRQALAAVDRDGRQDVCGYVLGSPLLIPRPKLPTRSSARIPRSESVIPPSAPPAALPFTEPPPRGTTRWGPRSETPAQTEMGLP